MNRLRTVVGKKYQKGAQAVMISDEFEAALALRWHSEASFNAVQSFLRLNLGNCYQQADLDELQDRGARLKYTHKNF